MKGRKKISDASKRLRGTDQPCRMDGELVPMAPATTLPKPTEFTSIDDQAAQADAYIQEHLNGHLESAYGLSMGGKILSRMMERGEIGIDHAIMDAAPLLPLPKWLVGPLRYYQCANVWTCYHWTGFWKWVFHSHYFDTLLDECKKVWPLRIIISNWASVGPNLIEGNVTFRRMGL